MKKVSIDRIIVVLLALTLIFTVFLRWESSISPEFTSRLNGIDIAIGFYAVGIAFSVILLALEGKVQQPLNFVKQVGILFLSAFLLAVGAYYMQGIELSKSAFRDLEQQGYSHFLETGFFLFMGVTALIMINSLFFAYQRWREQEKGIFLLGPGQIESLQNQSILTGSDEEPVSLASHPKTFLLSSRGVHLIGLLAMGSSLLPWLAIKEESSASILHLSGIYIGAWVSFLAAALLLLCLQMVKVPQKRRLICLALGAILTAWPLVDWMILPSVLSQMTSSGQVGSISMRDVSPHIGFYLTILLGLMMIVVIYLADPSSLTPKATLLKEESGWALHPQRILLLVLSFVTLLPAFFPWITLAFFGTNMEVNAFRLGVGAYLLVIASIMLVYSLVGKKKEPLSIGGWTMVSLYSLLLVVLPWIHIYSLFYLGQFINQGLSSLNASLPSMLQINILSFLHTGRGPYLSMIVGGLGLILSGVPLLKHYILKGGKS